MLAWPALAKAHLAKPLLHAEVSVVDAAGVGEVEQHAAARGREPHAAAAEHHAAAMSVLTCLVIVVEWYTGVQMVCYAVHVDAVHVDAVLRCHHQCCACGVPSADTVAQSAG